MRFVSNNLSQRLSPSLSKHVQDYDHFNLEVGYEDGRDRVLLWLPTICKHVITDDSPLASWLKPSGIMADADATIVIVVRETLPSVFLRFLQSDSLCMPASGSRRGRK